MTYRDRETTWRRALEEAQALVREPTSSYAGRIPTVRRTAEALASSLAEARSDGDAALVEAMQGTLATLTTKLADAERAPDIVVPAPLPERPPTRGLPRWPDHRLLWPIEMLLAGPRLDPWRSTLARAAGAVPLAPEEADDALAAMTPLVERARWQYELAFESPFLYADEELGSQWEKLANTLWHVEIVLAVIGARRDGASANDPYTAAERQVIDAHERIRSQLRTIGREKLVTAALETKRGVQLSVCQVAFRPSFEADAARAALVAAQWGPLRPPAELERDLPYVEQRVLATRALLEKAESHPEPADGQTEAMLAELWARLIDDVTEAEKAVKSAKQRLGRK